MRQWRSRCCLAPHRTATSSFVMSQSNWSAPARCLGSPNAGNSAKSTALHKATSRMPCQRDERLDFELLLVQPLGETALRQARMESPALAAGTSVVKVCSRDLLGQVCGDEGAAPASGASP